MSKITAIFFDLDGTIVDSEPLAAHVLKQCFQGWGIDLLESEANSIVGRTWAAALNELLGKYKMPVSKEEVFQTVIGAYEGELEIHGPKAIPGAQQAVKTLSEKYSLALVTGSNHAEAHINLKRLGIEKHFRFLHCSEDYRMSKPSPEPYQTAMKRLGVAPDQSLVFEDSRAGIQSAKDAGAIVVAVSAANHFRIDQSGADLVIEDLTQVDLEWIKKF